MTVSRREALVLGGLLGAGGLALVAVRALQPVGIVLGDTPVVRAVASETVPTGGNPAGDVSLAVFTDYNCPACRKAHPEMLAAVLEDGSTRLRYFDWPIFGADSRDAARVAIAADSQGLYPEVYTALMSGGRADQAAAEAAIAAAGGDLDRLRATLVDDGARIDGMLARAAFHAFALGLGGTPGHLVGRVLLRGAASRRDFARAIRRARQLGASPGG